jgi:hypothetical protein
MDSRVREMFLKYQKQGLTAKESAKMVQTVTGCSAVTGKPLSKRNAASTSNPNSAGEYKGQYGT